MFSGSSFSITTTGTIYVPNAQFRLTGPEHEGGQIVAKSINIGNSSLDITFSAATSARPKLPRLAR